MTCPANAGAQGQAFKGFTAKYGVTQLVWFEEHPSRDLAFVRERRIKEWNRLWKIGLIERMNPNWRDLTSELEWRIAG